MRISDWSSDVCSSDLEMVAADARGMDVARVHSGDPSLYGAIAEQMRRLDALGIPYDVTPGVPAFAAAAAALKTELTLPEIAQTVILTRTAVRSRSEEHTSELPSLMRNSYAVFCLKKKKNQKTTKKKHK